MEEDEKIDFGNPRKNRMYEALKNSLGVVSTAARMVPMDRSTHYKWITPGTEWYDEKYAKAVDDLGDVSIDFAESKLFDRINGTRVKETKVFIHDGQIVTYEVDKQYPPDTSAIQYYLSTKGKGRGYVKRTEIEDLGQPKPMIIEVVRRNQTNEDAGIQSDSDDC